MKIFHETFPLILLAIYKRRSIRCYDNLQS